MHFRGEVRCNGGHCIVSRQDPAPRGTVAVLRNVGVRPGQWEATDALNKRVICLLVLQRSFWKRGNGFQGQEWMCGISYKVVLWQRQ